MKKNAIGVIPARYPSTRLPGKPLIQIAGKSLIQWVWESAKRCQNLDAVLVATDDERILTECARFGAEVVMTSPDCPSGSDRIAEAIHGRPQDIVVNIQGDEPLIDPSTIDACVQTLTDDPAAGVSSAMTPFRPEEDYTQPHMVKVVTDSLGHAMYFSRAPIPDLRRLDAAERKAASAPMKHVGLYAYRRAVLEQFVTMAPSRYEILEKLEQLRLLEAGVKIRMITIDHAAIGVDTPEDVAIVEQMLRG